MKKIFRNLGIVILIDIVLIGTLCMLVPNIQPNDDVIHLRISKIYTIGVSTKCYDLIPNEKYQDLNHITIYGDSGSQLKIDQQVDLVIIKK